MPKGKRKPFSLFKKPTQGGAPIWYARFWDAEAQRYAVTRSTQIEAIGKRERKAEAMEAARAMLSEIKFMTPSTAKLFLDYVADFWTPEGSYVRERALVQKKPLSTNYISMNHDTVRRHMKPFPGFRGLTLRDLKPGHLRDWTTWAAEQGFKPRTINVALQAMRIAVRYAIEREELARDPFEKIKEAPEAPAEKGILTAQEVAAVIAAPDADPRARLAVLLGILCGMRRGEVRGLLWGDVDEAAGLIRITHNYIEGEGLKAPKWDSSRTVPIPQAVENALASVRAISARTQVDNFVLDNLAEKPSPVSVVFPQNSLRRILTAAGISRDTQEARRITFHQARHTYVTLGRLAGISDLEIQALAGHKSAAMMDHYSHAGQVLDFAAAKRAIDNAVTPKASGGK